MLKSILRRQLEEAGVWSIVLEKIRAIDLAAIRAVGTISVVVGVVERRVVQEIESIHTELQRLLPEGWETLEERHIDAIVPGTVEDV